MSSTPPRSGNRARGLWVPVLFGISGALGLGYQVLWSRFLLDVIGASAYSQATVLASFMGGLALGSAVLGRTADRAGSPLRLYAALEAGIGLYALAYPRLLDAVATLYTRWAALAPDQAGHGYGLLAKAAASGLLLLVPTFLMGGTYPAVLRHTTRALGLVGREAARLYAANAAGAVAGALAMAFLVMPALGMRRSLLALGVANGMVALAALVLARGTAEASAEQPAAAPTPSPPGGAWPALALILAAGFFAFGLEIAWTRYLSLVLGSSTYSFALMLAAFISGIALGSAWLRKLEARIEHPLRAFGWTQMLAGACVLLPLPLYPYGPWLLANYGALFSNEAAAFLPYQLGMLLLAYLLMLPATIPLGMALPLVVKGLALDLGRLGREAGRVYAWNTWGDVAGALLAGLVLLPALGVERLLRGAALGSVLTGVVAVWLWCSGGDRGRRLRIAAVALGAALAAYGLVAGHWAREWFTLSPFRRYAETRSFSTISEGLRAYHVLLFEDDAASNVMVYDSAGSARVLAVNAKADASSVGDMPTQVLVGHIPLLLARDPQDVLVVGLGSGATSGAVLAHPVRRLDVVEIARAMPKAARLFDAWNGSPMADPRFHLVVDDARSYLAYARRRYDVVVSEPSNPWMAGVGSLFSREFYARAAGTLRPGGVFMQWVQTYEMSDETFAAIVRTLRGVFPHVYAFQGNAMDALLLACLEPLRPDWPEVAARFESPRVRASLGRIGIRDLATLLALQRLSPTTVDFIAASSADENTSDNHLLEHSAPSDLFRRASVSLVTRLDERLHAGPRLLWRRYLQDGTPRPRLDATLQALTDTRMRVEGVTAALQLAAYHLDPGGLAGPAASLYPPSYAFAPPPSPAELVARLNQLVAQGHSGLAGDVLASAAPAILLESALSEDQALFWIRASAPWMRPAAEALAPRLRVFHVELLMTCGRTADAARELTEWIAETPPPDVEWATLRACEIDHGELCSRVLERYAESSPAAFVGRLRDLRRGRASTHVAAGVADVSS